MKKILLASLALALTLLGTYCFFHQRSPVKLVTDIAPNRLPGESRDPGFQLFSEDGLKPGPRPPPGRQNHLEEMKSRIIDQLNEPEIRQRTLEIPPPPLLLTEEKPIPPIQPLKLDSRAIGRKKREGLPLGVVIWDNVPVFESTDRKKILFTMHTADMVRVFDDSTNSLYHVQPGLDVYLAATTKETKPAGLHLPDLAGWVMKSELQVFEPDAAKEYLLELSPVTLGNDESFSTLQFYERGMKNPDPVVHRVVGPRLISLVLLHEDYSSSWSALYRDRDSKIRDAALSALSQRGVANNRPLIEDLIVRLTELTTKPARDEAELEVLSILNVLKASQHPRVPAALASFKEAWKETQGEKINEALADIFVSFAQ